MPNTVSWTKMLFYTPGRFFYQNNSLRALLGGGVWIKMEKIHIHTHFYTFVLIFWILLRSIIHWSQKNVFLLFCWFWGVFGEVLIRNGKKANFAEILELRLETWWFALFNGTRQLENNGVSGKYEFLSKFAILKIWIIRKIKR